MMEEGAVSFFSLPLHDVVFPHIFCHLEILEVWQFRSVCSRFLAICDDFFRVCFSLTIHDSHVANHFGAVYSILGRCQHLVEFRLIGLHYSSVLPSSYSGIIKKYEALLTILTSSGESVKLRRLSLKSLELTALHKMMSRLAICCSQLDEIVLCSISSFDDEALDILMSQCNHMKLVKLTVRNLHIQGRSLLKLVSQCPNLKYLCVAYSHRLKLPYLEEVFKSCPKLEQVDMRYMGLVNDRTMLVLGEYCQQLKQLFVEGCAMVTESALTPLRECGVRVDVPFRDPEWKQGFVLGQI